LKTFSRLFKHAAPLLEEVGEYQFAKLFLETAEMIDEYYIPYPQELNGEPIHHATL